MLQGCQGTTTLSPGCIIIVQKAQACGKLVKTLCTNSPITMYEHAVFSMINYLIPDHAQQVDDEDTEYLTLHKVISAVAILETILQTPSWLPSTMHPHHSLETKLVPINNTSTNDVISTHYLAPSSEHAAFMFYHFVVFFYINYVAIKLCAVSFMKHVLCLCQ